MLTSRSFLAAAALGLVLAFGATALSAGAWPKKPGKGAAASSKALIAEGKTVYNANCVGCHVIGNSGGKVGPALTHVGKTRNAAWLTDEIRNPKKHNHPRMPAYSPAQIDNAKLKALVAYLVSLK